MFYVHYLIDKSIGINVQFEFKSFLFISGLNNISNGYWFLVFHFLVMLMDNWRSKVILGVVRGNSKNVETLWNPSTYSITNHTITTRL